MHLVTYYRYGLGAIQVERVDAAEVDRRVAELREDRAVSEIEVWQKHEPQYAPSPVAK